MAAAQTELVAVKSAAEMRAGVAQEEVAVDWVAEEVMALARAVA